MIFWNRITIRWCFFGRSSLLRQSCTILWSFMIWSLNNLSSTSDTFFHATVNLTFRYHFYSNRASGSNLKSLTFETYVFWKIQNWFCELRFSNVQFICWVVFGCYHQRTVMGVALLPIHLKCAHFLSSFGQVAFSFSPSNSFLM